MILRHSFGEYYVTEHAQKTIIIACSILNKSTPKPRLYVVLHDHDGTSVGGHWSAKEGKKVRVLSKGDIVGITEVKYVQDENRVRGKTEDGFSLTQIVNFTG